MSGTLSLSHKCRKGKYFSKTTGRCRRKCKKGTRRYKNKCRKSCKTGFRRSRKTRRCRKISA